MKKEKYIRFDLVHQNEKTQIYAVRNCKNFYILGYIKWYGAWRQYCFEPINDLLIFSEGCLRDIADFIKDLMVGRKINDKTEKVKACQNS